MSNNGPRNFFQGTIKAGVTVQTPVVCGGRSVAVIVSPLGPDIRDSAIQGDYTGGIVEIYGVFGNRTYTASRRLVRALLPNTVAQPTLVAEYSGTDEYDEFYAVITTATQIAQGTYAITSSPYPVTAYNREINVREPILGRNNPAPFLVTDEYYRLQTAWHPVSAQLRAVNQRAAAGTFTVIAAPTATQRIVITELVITTPVITGVLAILRTTPGAVEVWRGYMYVNAAVRIGPSPHALVLPKGQGLEVTYATATSYAESVTYFLANDGEYGT